LLDSLIIQFIITIGRSKYILLIRISLL